MTDQSKTYNLYHLVTSHTVRKKLFILHAIVQAETEELALKWAENDDPIWKRKRFVECLPMPDKYPKDKRLETRRKKYPYGFMSIYETDRNGNLLKEI